MTYRMILWILLPSILFLSFPSFTVYAEENEFEFRVEPIFPKSQIGKQGYYHFKGKPNETVTLQAKVINDSEKELNVTIRSLNAYSGNQGILYQTEPILKGTAITNEEFQFTKVVKNPAELTLGPLESKVVSFSVNVPDINGTILGSIEFRVFKGTEELTKKEENSQLLIDQYKAVNVGVQVDVTDYQDIPVLTLEKPHFSPEQIAIMIPMENKHPVIVPNILGTYEITKQGDQDFSLKGDILPFKMAPMTVFHYPIQWTEGTLEPGSYHVTSTLGVNGKTQTYEQTFSIENKEVKETQEKMVERGEVEIAPKTFPWTPVIICLLVGIIVILLLILKRSKPKRKDRKYPGQDPN
ncbi:WxL protein host-binding domain-containing protein [Fredinandcohnia humi]